MTAINEHHNVVQLAERTQRKLRRLFRMKLLRSREQLAQAACEHMAHGLVADPLWQGVHELEEHLRRLFPAFWQAHYTGWVAADAARLHTADQPQPSSCSLCARRISNDTAPPQAS